MMTTGRIRYEFEHTALRDFYFEDPEHFAEVLLYRPDSLYWIMDSFYRRNGVKNPYRKGQVTAGLVRLSDGTCAVKLSLPAPEEAPLCHRIYAFLDAKEHRSGYFCIERTSTGGEDPAIIGQWHYAGKNWSHLGYGNRPSTQEEEFRMCAEYFRTFNPAMLVRLYEECEKGRKENGQEAG